MRNQSGVLQLRLHSRLHLLLSMGIVFVVFPALNPIWAADSLKIGILDPQAVIERSNAGKRELNSLKEHTAVRQKLLATDEEELKALETQLKENPNLPEDEKKAKEQLFRKKLQEYQKRGQEFQQELAQKQKALVEEYMKKIEIATTAVAERYGFSLIVDKGSNSTLKIVLYNRQELDITDKVVQEFNRKFK